MNTAVILTGTMCSGKSTISEKIQNEFKIKLISESNASTKSLLGMMYEIKNNKFEGIVLIEHAEILRYIDDLNKYFENLIIILLEVSDSILVTNFNSRKEQNAIGNYPPETVFTQKKYIEELFNNIGNKYIKYTANINDRKDYEIEYNKIINLIKVNTPNA